MPDLDVQFELSVRPGIGEVRRADQSEGADHVLPGMGNVGLGVELVLAVDPALDLTGADGLDNGGDAVQEIVLGLLGFQAGIEPLLTAQPLGKGGLVR